MRQIVGWVVVIVVVLVVAVYMSTWGLRNEDVLMFTSNIGGLAIGVFVAALVALFLAPLLGDEEQEEQDE